MLPSAVDTVAKSIKANRKFTVLYGPNESEQAGGPRSLLPKEERMFILVSGYGGDQRTTITDAHGNVVARGTTLRPNGSGYFDGGPILWESGPAELTAKK